MMTKATTHIREAAIYSLSILFILFMAAAPALAQEPSGEALKQLEKMAEAVQDTLSAENPAALVIQQQENAGGAQGAEDALIKPNKEQTYALEKSLMLLNDYLW